MAVDRHRGTEGLTPAGGAAVILDSNFFFVPFRFGVDIFEELQRLLGSPLRCIAPEPVIKELRALKSEAKPSLKKEIDFALGLIDRCETMEASLAPGENVDEFILKTALETGYPVATNDAELRRHLKEVGISVIYLRQRAYLEIDGFK
ncbi:MAG: PIN domain-containing protein [Candidatus Bathyarchaeia archaeon]